MSRGASAIREIPWSSIKADFSTGAYTFQALAEKYNVSRQSIHNKVKAEKWSRLDPLESSRLKRATDYLPILMHQNLPPQELSRALSDLEAIKDAQQRVAKELFRKLEIMAKEVDNPRDLNELASAFNKISSPFRENQTNIAVLGQMPAPLWGGGGE